MLGACANPTVSEIETLSPAEVVGLARSATGQVHVVSLWATWCVPCLDEIEVLRTIEPKDVRVDIVNIDTSDAFERRARPWLEQRDWKGTGLYRLTARDPISELSKAWSQWSGRLPYTVFLRPQGDVCEEYSHALTRADVTEAIERCRQ